MGKAQRERARRRAVLRPSSGDERPSVAPEPGAAFGLAPDHRATWGASSAAAATPAPRRQAIRATYEPSSDMLRRMQRADAVRAALERLGQLAEVRAEARAVVVRHEEQIRSAVEHVRLDGASWSQIGAALGISRQGARQRFGADPNGARRVMSRSPRSRMRLRPSEAWGETLPGQFEEEEPEWTSSRL